MLGSCLVPDWGASFAGRGAQIPQPFAVLVQEPRELDRPLAGNRRVGPAGLAGEALLLLELALELPPLELELALAQVAQLALEQGARALRARGARVQRDHPVARRVLAQLADHARGLD